MEVKVHFLKALFKTNSEINASRLAKGVLKIFGAKVLSFSMLCELTKNECFFFIFHWGGAKILVYNPLFIDRFFISLMVAELLFLNQEISYIMFNW